MSDPSIWDHLLALLVGVVLPAQSLLATRAKGPTEPMETAGKVATYWASSAVLWVPAGLVLWFLERPGRRVGAAWA